MRAGGRCSIGCRTLAVKSGGQLSLLSRNKNALNDRFPAIEKGAAALDEDTVVDGETVALDKW